MKVIEIAQIYTDLVTLDDQTPDNESVAKEEIGILRSKYHQMLMDKFTEEGIEFLDRFDAMRKAFEIVKQEPLVQMAQPSLRKTGT